MKHFSECSAAEVQLMVGRCIAAAIKCAEELHVGGLSHAGVHDLYAAIEDAIHAEWGRSRERMSLRRGDGAAHTIIDSLFSGWVRVNPRRSPGLKPTRALARCPWHHEETPGLIIYLDDRMFRCLGCGEIGRVTMPSSLEGIRLGDTIELTKGSGE